VTFARLSGKVTDVVLDGSYDLRVVALSLAIAVLGAYAGLDLAERVTAARGRARTAWLVGGVTATAIGIWSMHYTAMLAFDLPVPLRYDWIRALAAFLSAFFAALVSLVVVTRKRMGQGQAFVGSLFMGAGISALHYIGMSSMRAPVMHHYAPAVVTLSVVLAVVFSFLSLRLAFFFREGNRGLKGRRVASIVLLGAAISVMHYTGMAAVSFTRSFALFDSSHALPVSFLGTLAIASTAVMVLGVVVVTSMFDRLHQHQEFLRATSEQLRALSASVSSAREDEGIRIARELHDELGSALTALKWDLETVSSAVSDSLDRPRAETIRRQLAAMMAIVDATIGGVRRIATDLRPGVLDDLGIADAIEWQVHQFQARTGIATRLEGPAEPVELTTDQATAVFRILQEALTNILRHSGASRVDVWAEVESGVFTLRVSDNGRGTTGEEPSAVRPIGILGMRERAARVGGTFDIVGSQGQGTTIIVRVPLHPVALEDRP
jgi:signal transduction histidine kinase